MPCILNIETSTNVCSVAVSVDGTNIFTREESEGPSHATLLGVFVKEAMDYIRCEKIKAEAIAVSSGPGSYTGLRIGVSEAKGLCYGLDIPLISLNTPLIMAAKVAQSTEKDTFLCPMIDARRMEVYAAIYDSKLNIKRGIHADIVDESTYLEYLKDNKIVFFGNGAEKCKDILSHPNASFLDGIYPLAADMTPLATEAFEKQQFENIAYFEPFYLKEFVATTPKNKLF